MREQNILYNVLWDYTWTDVLGWDSILYNVLWDYTWTINTSEMRQNTTFYIMYCEIIHELLIHQDKTEHNILYNVLWDYTWTINTSGRDRTQHSIQCTMRLLHELS